MRYKNFTISTDNHYEHYSEYTLSVFCLPECNSGEEVARKCPEFDRDVFRESTVGLIRTAGYDVEPDEPPYGHALIKLPSSPPPSRQDWQKLNTIFGAPKENPYYEESE